MLDSWSHLMSPSERSTIKQVAERAGVSTSTVSRVLNDFPYVRPAVRQAVLNAMQALSYRTDSVARSLRTRRTMAVGMLVGDINNPVLAGILRSASDVLTRSGYFVVIAQQGNSGESEGNLLRLLLSRQIDGLMWSLVNEDDPEVRSRITAPHIPIVLVDRYLSGVGADCVVADHFGGALSALQSLLDCGHERIAILTGPLTQWPGKERLRAYRTALKRAGIKIDRNLIATTNADVVAGYQATLNFLQMVPRPTALVAGGNRVSVGALRALADAHVSVPSQLSFVAGSAPELAEVMSPALSRISLPLEAMGNQMATCLLERLEGRVQGPGRFLKLRTEYTLASSVQGVGAKRTRSGTRAAQSTTSSP